MAVSPSLIARAIRWRRDFHAYLSWGIQEQETSRRVAELLSFIGLQVSPGWRVRAWSRRWENGPGPVVGLQAGYGCAADNRSRATSAINRANPGVIARLRPRRP